MKFNKIFSALCGGLLLAGFSACTDKVEYSPAEAILGNGVYFDSKATSDALVSIPKDANELQIPLFRTNADGALTVGLQAKFTDADGNPLTDENGQSLVIPFEVPTQVTFVSGETKTIIPVSVDFANVVAEVGYYMHLKVVGEEGTPYGLPYITYELRYSPWSDWKRCGGKEDYATVTLSAFGISGRQVPVYYSKSLVGAGTKYCFGGVGMPGYEDVEEGSKEWSAISYVNGNNFIVSVPFNLPEKVNEDDPEVIYPTENCLAFMAPAETGDSESFGSMLMVCDIYTFRHTINNSYMSQYPESTLYVQSQFDATTGLFDIYTTYYYGGNTAYGSMREYMQLPGFKSYGCQIEYVGNIIDLNKNEKAVITITRTDDTASYSYDLYQGALDAAQVEAAAKEIAESDLDRVVAAQTNVSYTIPEEGDYTVVVVSFDEDGKQVHTDYLTFKYESMQKAEESPWEDVGQVLYTEGILYGSIKFEDGSYLGGDQYPVMLQRDKENANHYRLANPYDVYAPYGIVMTGDYGISFWVGEQTPYVVIEQSEIGIDDPYGDGSTFCMSASVGNFVGEGGYTVDQLSKLDFKGGKKCVNYMGVMDDSGLITFPACTVVQTWSSLMKGDETPWYFSNYNDAALEASANKTLNATSIYNHEYGNGLLEIDMSDAGINAPAKIAKKGGFISKNAPLRLLEAKQMNLNGKKKATGKTFKGKTISAKEMLNGTLRQPKLSIR